MHTLARQIERLAVFIGAVGLILMMLQVTVDVVGKYFFHAPMPLTMEMVSFYYMSAVVFLPLLTLERRGSSLVHVELVYDRLPRRLRAGLLPLSLLLSALYCGAASWAALQPALVAMHRGTYAGSSFIVAVWPTRFFPVAGFALVAIALVAKALTVLLKGIDAVEGPAAPEHELEEGA